MLFYHTEIHSCSTTQNLHIHKTENLFISLFKGGITYCRCTSVSLLSPISIYQYVNGTSCMYTASFAYWLRCPPRERKILGSNPAWAKIFPGSSHSSYLKIGTPKAILPGTWRYMVSAGTGRPSVSILWLGEMESSVCNFYLSVAACKIVWADPSLRYTCMLLGH